MGADNWAICPRCLRRAEEALRKQKLKVGASYGKVSADEYIAALEGIKEIDRYDFPQTFREDYEIGVCDDGTFYISYGGSCKTCDLSYHFKHEEKLKI